MSPKSNEDYYEGIPALAHLLFIHLYPKEDPLKPLKMTRQSHNPTIVSSSIALLQERFRQLEKARERREERELLKLFSDSSQVAPPMLSLQQHSSFPSRPSLQDPSLPLRLDDAQTMKHLGFESPKMQPSSTSTSTRLESSDVDTSLHL